MAKRSSTGFDKTSYKVPVIAAAEPGRAKGVEGQKCNVSACRSPASAEHFNFSTGAFYCIECAFQINRANRDFERDHEFPLLCKVPQPNEYYEFENRGLIRNTGFTELFSKEVDGPIKRDHSDLYEKVSKDGSYIHYAHAKMHVPTEYIKNATNNIFIGIGKGNHAQRDVSWTAIEVLFLSGYDQHLVLEIQHPEHPKHFEHFALTPGVVYEFNATVKHRFLTKYPNTLWGIATCYINKDLPISVAV